MKARHRAFTLVLALVSAAQSRGQGLPRSRQLANERLSVGVLNGMLGIRETLGNNRGPEVDALIRAGGGQPGWPWCGYTQGHVQKALALPVPNGFGRAALWFVDPLRTYYRAGLRGSLDSIRVGHPVGLGTPVYHVTRVVLLAPPLRAGRPPRGFYCIGGNEGVGVTAGVHYTFYPAAGIGAAANWSQ